MPQSMLQNIRETEFIRRSGYVLDFNGLVIEANGPDVSLGELCEVHPRSGLEAVPAEVVGFRNGRVLLMPYGNTRGISPQSEVIAKGQPLGIPVGDALLGRVVNAFSQPLDEKGGIALNDEYPLYREPINPLHRKPIHETVETGIRAIDSMLTLGKGQRIGIFAGSGVGKSTLLGMLSRNVETDVNVIAMIGERGREVWDFIHENLGEEGLKRSVVLVATADQPALVRTHAVHAATAIAEYFRDQGRDVMLMMDSITRFALAQREVGLAAGEPPASRGYTPSVFSQLPRILERCGRMRSGGSITAVYSVLVEGDDLNDPVADNMRALLDGHIALSRDLANRGHYPAIDIGASVSRLLPRLLDKEELNLARRTAGLIARYEASRDLIDMGAYQTGANRELDNAVKRMPAIDKVLRQESHERESRETTRKMLDKALGSADMTNSSAEENR